MTTEQMPIVDHRFDALTKRIIQFSLILLLPFISVEGGYLLFGIIGAIVFFVLQLYGYFHFYDFVCNKKLYFFFEKPISRNYTSQAREKFGTSLIFGQMFASLLLIFTSLYWLFV